MNARYTVNVEEWGLLPPRTANQYGKLSLMATGTAWKAVVLGNRQEFDSLSFLHY